MEHKKELLQQWLDKGNEELRVAEYISAMQHPTPYETICYLCQQSAEKYLKGYLIFCGVDEPPKIHNLPRLCVLCSEHDETFIEILPQCEFLTGFGVQARYPDEIYIDEEMAKKAIDYAQKIKHFAPINELRKRID